MKNRNVNELDELISVMSKSEKRSLSMRLSGSKMLRLFNAINAKRPFNDKQLHNLKSQLYRQIVKVLRSSSVETTLQEGLDQARTFMERKLYVQSYKALLKVKHLSDHYHQSTYSLQVILLELKLRTIDPTLSDIPKIESLQQRYRQVSQELSTIGERYMLMLTFQELYFRQGVQAMINPMPEAPSLGAGFYQRFFHLKTAIYYKLLSGQLTDISGIDGLFEAYPQMLEIERSEYDRILRVINPGITEKKIFTDDPCIIADYLHTAKLYYNEGLYNNALDYLIPFLNTRLNYRIDLQREAKILLISCHSHLGNGSVIKSLTRSLKRMEQAAL
ncbi:hypothetical protein ACTJIJ_14655 [Niabella sp. 22666]|uniref:hypothetical protein n=1 Tax=Niabella sp. 22666 TaxID=3453954 RepID=UPI003F82A68A